MCLIRAEFVENQLRGQTEITGWKILQWCDITNCWRSLYRNYKRWHLGLNDSNRGTTELHQIEIETKEIHFGIHVFLNRKDAEHVMNKSIDMSPDVIYKIIEVSCQIKDMVAAGYHNNDHCQKQAVFTQVTVKEF